jgi:hypothetical protein
MGIFYPQKPRSRKPPAMRAPEPPAPAVKPSKPLRSTKQEKAGKDGCPPGFKKVNGRCVQKGVGSEYKP